MTVATMSTIGWMQTFQCVRSIVWVLADVALTLFNSELNLGFVIPVITTLHARVITSSCHRPTTVVVMAIADIAISSYYMNMF